MPSTPPPVLVPGWPLRWTLALVAVGLALVAWVSSILVDARHRREEQAAMASRPGVTVLGASQGRPPPVPVTHAVPAARSRLAASAPARAAGPGEVEVCGYGILPADPATAGPDSYPVPPAVATETQRRLSTLAREAGDVRVQAAALRVSMGFGPDSVTLAGRREGVDPVLQDRLARLAVDSSDPFAYALAIDGCGTLSRPGEGSGACQLLGLEQWTRLDPDNAAPWLNQAALAQERGDAGTASEAMHRALVARRVDWHLGSLPGLLLSALPADVPPAVRDQVLIAATGTAAALGLPGVVVPQRHCSTEALRDANRRQDCEQLATLLVERGSTWLDVGLGREVGRRVGWPAERVQALQEESTLLLDHVIGEHLSGSAPGSCAAMQRRADWVARVQARGEPAAARELLRRSGRTLEQLRDAAERRAPGSPLAVQAQASAPLALTASGR